MFQAMFMSSTPSSALRPAHGEPAECAVLPVKVYSTETAPLLLAGPQDVLNSLLTWVKMQASTPSNRPALT